MTSRRVLRRRNMAWPKAATQPQAPATPQPEPVAPASGGGYRRLPVSPPDDDGFVWVDPRPATKWPNVLPDGRAGRPPGPRTNAMGYSIEERKVRTVFRDGTTWQYSGVTPQEWERIRRTASTGQFINRVLNHHPYGPESF